MSKSKQHSGVYILVSFLFDDNIWDFCLQRYGHRNARNIGTDASNSNLEQINKLKG